METLQTIVGADLDAPDIDIVAVHGLDITGDKMHAETTWTATNGKMWLKDFLPSKIPKARILLFGYDANATFNPCAQNVKGPAEKLLELLKRARENASHRPIIFICHSIGGLVVKQALKIANWTKPYAALNNATFSIVFFGTPHHEDNLIALGIFVSHVIRTRTPGAANNESLQSLERDGFMAEELSEKFRGRVEDFWNVSFYEDTLTKISDEQIGKVVKDRGPFSTMKSHEKTKELAGDHISICKFESETTENWKIVEGLLVGLVENALKARQKADVLLKTRPPFAKMEDISLYNLLTDPTCKHRYENLF